MRGSEGGRRRGGDRGSERRWVANAFGGFQKGFAARGGAVPTLGRFAARGGAVEGRGCGGYFVRVEGTDAQILCKRV